MTLDEKIDLIIEYFVEQNGVLDSDAFYDKLGDSNDMNIRRDIDVIKQFLLKETIVITPNDYTFYLQKSGYEISDYGGWIKFKQNKDLKDQITEKKERTDAKLSDWQAKTFWWIFAFAVIGGFSGIISLILQLIE